jgi:hypothetical protein
MIYARAFRFGYDFSAKSKTAKQHLDIALFVRTTGLFATSLLQ